MAKRSVKPRDSSPRLPFEETDKPYTAREAPRMVKSVEETLDSLEGSDKHDLDLMAQASASLKSLKPKMLRLRNRETAESMAAKQKDIAVSEFFAKNRHLLGFDNPRKALLTTVKEAVDNSLDACEEAGITPEIWVAIEAAGTNRFKVSVQDNGPGIMKKTIPLIFGKLLYG